MRKKMARLLVCVCCVAMLFTAFGTLAYAHEIDTSKNASIKHPVQTGYAWQPVTSVTGTEQQAKDLIQYIGESGQDRKSVV